MEANTRRRCEICNIHLYKRRYWYHLQSNKHPQNQEIREQNCLFYGEEDTKDVVGLPEWIFKEKVSHEIQRRGSPKL